MARDEVTGRRPGSGTHRTMRSRPATTGPPAKRPRKPPTYGKTPAQFCAAYGISRGTWNNWKRDGIAPAVTQPAGPGGWQIITPESEEDWKRKYTALTTAAE